MSCGCFVSLPGYCVAPVATVGLKGSGGMTANEDRRVGPLPNAVRFGLVWRFRFLILSGLMSISNLCDRDSGHVLLHDLPVDGRSHFLLLVVVPYHFTLLLEPMPQV
jgi:hypothetical protein